MIGDPIVLSLDPLWRKFMTYVRSGGGWRGAELDIDIPEDIDDEDYVQLRRSRAETQLELLIERWSTVGNIALEDDDGEGNDDEDEFEIVAADVPWRERAD